MIHTTSRDTSTVYAHVHSIIHDPATRRRVSHCMLALCPFARSRGEHMRAARGVARSDAILHARARGAATRFSSIPAQSLDQAWAK